VEPSDLGITDDVDSYQMFVDLIGAPPPWPLHAVTSALDQHYSGWDSAPQLNMSSPLARLCTLTNAWASDGADCAEIDEALRELRGEVKHAQLRLLISRIAGNSLQDECSFLVVALDNLGAKFLSEREFQRRQHEATRSELDEMKEVRRKRTEEAVENAKEEFKQQIEELTKELHLKEAQAEQFQQDSQALNASETRCVEVEAALSMLEQEHVKLKQEYAIIQERLMDTKTRCEGLISAREESEDALDQIHSKLERHDFEGAVALTSQLVCGPPAPAAAADECAFLKKSMAGESRPCSRQGRRLERLARGALAAIGFVDSCHRATEGLLLPTFLAWRCVQLQSKFSCLGKAAAASSLEAVLALLGPCGKIGHTPCCCHVGSKVICCRALWLKAACQR